MEGEKEFKVEDYTYLCGHPATRPMKFYMDSDGHGWLCDKKAEPGRDPRAKGCWRCDEMAFPMGGR